MLCERRDLDALLDEFAADIVHGFTIRHFCTTAKPDELHLLVDDFDRPHVLLALAGAELMLLGQFPFYTPAMGDLLAGRVETRDGWPTRGLRAAWESHGSRHLFLNSGSLASWRAARIAGFSGGEAGHEEYLAYQWHWQGAPRLSGLVAHPCRVVEGAGLLEHLKLGVWYGASGTYVEECVATGPSFVCELPATEHARLAADLPLDAAATDPGAEPAQAHRGFAEPLVLRPGWVPVSWAGTHLNGTMGMIYTPPQLRRHGFARSLGAFQIDSMLAREGIACCHIIDSNTPSMQLAAALGGTALPEPVVWRTVYWPEATPAQ